ncbi:MAG: HNH endonuclease [Desulfobulbaceae bacterium]|nr:HNH endonuclease [Desulfobulbaceae bacterium]
MNKIELKRQSFKKGASGLKKITIIEPECYCCPLCKRLFVAQAVDEGILTIEHAPPEKVGGTPLALTCKDCNSVSGYTIDAAVVEREKLIDAAKAITGQRRNYEGRATLKMGDELINVRIEVNEGAISIKPPLNINDPKKLTAYIDYMMYLHKEGKWDGETFNIKPMASFKNKYSRIGDLKSAFIVSFAKFGYKYVLSKQLSPVREQILNYDSDIIDKYWLSSDQKIDHKYFICILDEPVSAVAIKLDKATVLLPWFGSPGNFYQYLEHNFQDEKQLSFHGSFLKWPESLEMEMDFFKNI